MKKIAFFVMLATLLFAGCEKDWWQIFKDDDEGFAIKEVPCEVDLGGVSTDGLTVMSSVGGFACGGDTSSLSVVDTSSPQMVMVLDDNENVLGLYRGLMYEGRPVSVTVHSTALAMVTSNPALAVYADGMLDALEQSVVSDPAFAELERQVGAAIGAGRDIFDTTNTAMRTAFDTVMQHIFGEDPDAEAKGVEDALPFVDHTPLRAERNNNCLYLSNYCLVPTYYGTVTDEDGKSTNLVIPCREDYTLGSITFQNILCRNDIRYGEQVFVPMGMGNNTIELTNWGNAQAKTTFALSLLNDGLRIIGVPFTGKQKAEMAITVTSFVADAVSRCTTAGGFRIKEIAKAAMIAMWEQLKTDGAKIIAQSMVDTYKAKWAQLALKVGVDKLVAWYGLGLGVGNGTTRLYDFLRYPHDLSFCVNVSNGSEGKAIEWGECKGDIYFSVSATKKVLFAPGNLDYNGGYFFTAHQYDYGGYFGWGTGSNPTLTSTDYGDYPTFDDWGNHIAGGWRTLTWDEWYYVTWDRADASAKRGAATVCGVHGMILLPDNWSGGTLHAGFNVDWSANVYDASSWAAMETAGAVFLPAAGYRYGTEMYDVGAGGYYWSSTPYYEGYAYDEYFGTCYANGRGNGHSVRLVQDY